MRLLRTCHALAMLCWWVGFMAFAWYLLAPFQWKAEDGVLAHITWPFSQWASGVLQQILEEPLLRWGGMELDRRHPQTPEEMAQALVIQHPDAWLTWYYSPLNTHHWGVAMLCFTPALGLTLLTRHLEWCRQH